MAIFVQTLDLKDDPASIAAYRRHHDEIWPEVVKAIRSTGIQDLKIYIHANRLVMIIRAPEGFDPVTSFGAYRDDPAAQRWEALMQTLQRQLPGAAPGQWWTTMRQMFDLDDAAIEP